MKYKITKIILAYIFMLVSLRLFGGNVTLVTHGFNSAGTMTNGWLWNLAKQIGSYERRTAEYGGNNLKTFYQVQIINDQFKSKRMDFGTSFNKNPSGDIIIVLDWNPYSSSILSPIVASTTEVAPFIAQLLVQDGAFEGINGPLSQFPIHLIGHSRGGSLVCEIGRALGEYGVYTHQITTLDPHPLNNDGFGNVLELIFGGSVVDGSAKDGITKSVVFADNYFQQNNTFAPNGTFVNGAANRNLSTNFVFPLRIGDDEHGLVHTWYYATTYDEFPYISNGKVNLYPDERVKWFSPAENIGKNAGYFYSHRGGQKLDNFSIKGYDETFLDNILFGAGQYGNKSRAIPPKRVYGNKSKNILGLFSANTNLIESKNFEFGNSIEYIQTTRIGNQNLGFKLIYQADFPGSQPNGSIQLTVFIDKFENIYYGNNRSEDTNSIIGEVVTLPSTGEWNINNAIVDYSNLVSRLKPGFYRVGAVIGDGLDSRIFYANERIFVEPDAKIDIKYVAEQNLFGFTLFGTVGRQFVFERSLDLIKWEQTYSGKFLEYEAGNYSGKNFTTGTGIGPMTYWRLRYN